MFGSSSHQQFFSWLVWIIVPENNYPWTPSKNIWNILYENMCLDFPLIKLFHLLDCCLWDLNTFLWTFVVFLRLGKYSSSWINVTQNKVNIVCLPLTPPKRIPYCCLWQWARLNFSCDPLSILQQVFIKSWKCKIIDGGTCSTGIF